MNHRKGQAALEFLMTYGWAILVVLVAIAALAFFGVLSPDNFLPSKCVLQPGIACLDFRVAETQVDVVIQNSLGYAITVDTVEIDNCPAISPASNVANSGQYSIVMPGCTLLNGGDRYSSALNITYTNSQSSLQKKNVGEITTKVE